MDVFAGQSAHAGNALTVREVFTVGVGIDHVVIRAEIFGQELAAFKDAVIEGLVAFVLGLRVDRGQDALDRRLGALVHDDDVAARLANQVPLGIGDAPLVFRGGRCRRGARTNPQGGAGV